MLVIPIKQQYVTVLHYRSVTYCCRRSARPRPRSGERGAPREAGAAPRGWGRARVGGRGGWRHGPRQQRPRAALTPQQLAAVEAAAAAAAAAMS
jgi:hypothetical protein